MSDSTATAMHAVCYKTNPNPSTNLPIFISLTLLHIIPKPQISKLEPRIRIPLTDRN